MGTTALGDSPDPSVPYLSTTWAGALSHQAPSSNSTSTSPFAWMRTSVAPWNSSVDTSHLARTLRPIQVRGMGPGGGGGAGAGAGGGGAGGGDH